MRVIDLSLPVSDWDRNAFAPQETYFKLRPIVKWEDGLRLKMEIGIVIALIDS